MSFETNLLDKLDDPILVLIGKYLDKRGFYAFLSVNSRNYNLLKYSEIEAKHQHFKEIAPLWDQPMLEKYDHRYLNRFLGYVIRKHYPEQVKGRSPRTIEQYLDFIASLDGLWNRVQEERGWFPAWFAPILDFYLQLFRESSTNPHLLSQLNQTYGGTFKNPLYFLIEMQHSSPFRDYRCPTIDCDGKKCKSAI